MIETMIETRMRTRTGHCPVCWDTVELNMAGRVRPHMFMLHQCTGGGSLPRTGTPAPSERPKIPARITWWRYPTCQDCGTALADSDDQPRWNVTHEIRFVCLHGCARMAAVGLRLGRVQ
jgi:hypothetical protein